MAEVQERLVDAAEPDGRTSHAECPPHRALRLAWTLHRDSHVLAIPGTGNPDHLEENVATGALRLTGDEVARLDGVHRKAS